jgi:hypothetical protein
MRQLLVALLLSGSAFAAQVGAPQEVPELPPSPAPRMVPPPASGYRAVVRAHPPSPPWTQDRSFTSSRFWLLDPGSFEVEMWLRTRFPHEVNGVRGLAEILWQHEIEMGVWPHVQIDLYENLDINVGEDGKRTVTQEGNQIEARIAIPSYYGQYFGNPVIYLEWHPRHNQPDRAEVRLLLGGAPTRWFYLVVNPYVETNIEPTETQTAVIDPATNMPKLEKSNKFIADMEFGTTVAAGFRVSEWLRLSAELKIGADMLGDADNRLHFVWFLGPGFILKPLPGRYRQYLKIMGTCLFAMPGTNEAAQQFEPLFIIGSQF